MTFHSSAATSSAPIKESTKTTSNDSIDIHEAPHLLSLPTELRIAIWEYVPIKPKTMVLTPQLEIPALFSINTQIFSETAPIWTSKNLFRITIRDCVTSLTYKWYDLKHSLRAMTRQQILNDCSYHLRGRDNWPNLLAWYKRPFETGLWGVPTAETCSDLHGTCCSGSACIDEVVSRA